MSMGAGKSSYTKMASAEFTVNTDSTSTISVGSINLPAECYTSDKLLYIKVRDKAGPRVGYHYGQDGFMSNPNPANQKTGVRGFGNTIAYYYDANGEFAVNNTAFGVYPSGVSNAGVLSISARYNSTYTGTINGTYAVDVYLLDWPDDDSPFDD